MITGRKDDSKSNSRSWQDICRKWQVFHFNITLLWGSVFSGCISSIIRPLQSYSQRFWIIAGQLWSIRLCSLQYCKLEHLPINHDKCCQQLFLLLFFFEFWEEHSKHLQLSPYCWFKWILSKCRRWAQEMFLDNSSGI